MQCKICRQFVIEKKSFIGLFKFPPICEVCKKKYQLKERYEVFPVDYGEIYYKYYLETNSLSIDDLRFILFNAGIIYEEIIKNKNKQMMIIFIENYEYETFKEWFPVIKNFSKIMFISLEYFDFSKYVSFF